MLEKAERSISMEVKKLPVTCPLCGRKNEFQVDALVEGFILECPACKVKLRLHGHLLQEIQSEIERLSKT
jgi:hypothetical protein